ncbi:MAG: hypothetical protein GXO74_05780 [Calditrichaeota bacterium]|nr:hypothetical protein [Calditrichota bacterium]
MSENNRKSWQRIGVEIFSIVFAVILALVVNEWRQNYNRNRAVSRALALVRSEIVQNKDGMEHSIANQIAYRDSLKAILFSKSKRRLKNQSFAKIYSDLQREINEGLQIAPMLSTAWTTAKELGIIRDIDYSLAMKFSEMEEQNKLLNSRFQSLTKIFYGSDFFKNRATEEVVGPVFIVLTDLISTEQGLVEIYQEILDKLDKNTGTIPTAAIDSLKN